MNVRDHMMETPLLDLDTVVPLGNPVFERLWEFDSGGSAVPGRRAKFWAPEPSLRVLADGYELLLPLQPGGSGAAAEETSTWIDLALVVEAPLVGLLFHLDTQESWNHVYCALPLIPDTIESGAFDSKTWPSQRCAQLRVRLVDPLKRILLLDRTLDLDPKFSAALYAALRHQVHTTFDPASYVRAVTRLCLDYPTSDAMLDLAVARTTVAL